MLTTKQVEKILAKSVAWHENRRKGLGGSDMKVVMEGTEEERHALYLNKITPTPEDYKDPLKNIVAVQMGSFTESLNVYWTEKYHDVKIVSRNKVFSNHRCPVIRASVDGIIKKPVLLGGRNVLYEAKHCSHFYQKQPEKILQRYYWQLQAGMLACDANEALLAVFFGNNSHEVFEVSRHEDDVSKMIGRANDFWNNVEMRKPPPLAEPVVAPLTSIGKKVDMTGNNRWASAAWTWLDRKEAAKLFNDSTKDLKSMVESDTTEAKGHGVVVKRDKAGSLRITPEQI